MVLLLGKEWQSPHEQVHAVMAHRRTEVGCCLTPGFGRIWSLRKWQIEMWGNIWVIIDNGSLGVIGGKPVKTWCKFSVFSWNLAGCAEGIMAILFHMNPLRSWSGRDSPKWPSIFQVDRCLVAGRRTGSWRTTSSCGTLRPALNCQISHDQHKFSQKIGKVLKSIETDVTPRPKPVITG